MNETKAVRCQVCLRLVDPGEGYGELGVAAAGLHAKYEDEEGFGIACPIESASDDNACPGSGMLGLVEKYPS